MHLLALLLAKRWSCYIQFQCGHSILCYVFKSLQVLTENKILYIDMFEAGFLGQISFQVKCKKIKRCHMISGGIGGFPEAKPVPCLSASTYCCFKPLYGCWILAKPSYNYILCVHNHVMETSDYWIIYFSFFVMHFSADKNSLWSDSKIKIILLFSMDGLNWSKVRVKIFIML